MTHPGIKDKETRDGLARTLWRWNRERHESLRKAAEAGSKLGKDVFINMATFNKQWIYGFRRALEIIDNP